MCARQRNIINRLRMPSSTKVALGTPTTLVTPATKQSQHLASALESILKVLVIWNDLLI
jgi:hypothetical protein